MRVWVGVFENFLSRFYLYFLFSFGVEILGVDEDSVSERLRLLQLGIHVFEGEFVREFLITDGKVEVVGERID